MAIADAEIQRAFTKEVEHAVSPPPPPRSRARQRSTWPDNATGRRLRAHVAACAPVQGVPNASEQADRENVREEAALEVAAGAEETQGEHAVDTQEDDDRDQMDAQADAYDIEQARGEGEGAEPAAMAMTMYDGRRRTCFSFSAGGARDGGRRAGTGAGGVLYGE